MRIRPRSSRRLLVLALLGLVIASCGNDSDEPRDEEGNTPTSGAGSGEPATTDPPVPGAVLSVAGIPILSAELDALADAAAIAVPEYTRAHHNRLALDTQLIPRAALEAVHGEARAAAKLAAEEALAAIRADPAASRGLEARTEAVDIRDLGIELWFAVHDGPRGKWLGPVEHLGRWRLARWLAVSHAPTPGDSEYTCELLDFWFLGDDEPQPWIDAALAEAELEIHDAAIGELVTERMRWRMKRR